MKNMNVLIITASFPYPLNSGGNQAQFNLIDQLRNQVNFSLLYFRNPSIFESENTLRQLWPEVKFYPIDIPKKKPKNNLQKVINKLWKWIYKPEKTILNFEYEYSALRDRSAEFVDSNFIEKLNRILLNDKIDIVQTEFYNMQDLVYCLPKSVKKLYIQHEIRFIRNQLERQVLSKENVYLDYVCDKLKSEEIAAINHYDGVVALTDIDKNKMLEAGVSIPIYTSPAAVHPLYRLSDERYIFDGTITFVGSGGHPPNRDGLKWFVESMWNKIIQLKPELQLRITGKWDDAFVENITNKHQNVYFCGYVDNLAASLSNSIMIVPLRIGSGMRMKILDAVNCQIPFITTSVGVEGLLFENEKDCLIADTEETFVANLLRLIDDVQLQNDFILHAKMVYDTNYSVDVLANRRLDVYKQIMNTTK